MSHRCWTKIRCSHDERTNCASFTTMHVQLTHPCPLLHQFFKRSVTDHGRAAGCLGRRQRGGGGPGAAGAAGRNAKTGGRPSTRRAQYQRVETIRGGTGASRWGHDGLAPSGSDVVVRCLVAGGLGLVVAAHGNGGKMAVAFAVSKVHMPMPEARGMERTAERDGRTWEQMLDDGMMAFCSACLAGRWTERPHVPNNSARGSRPR